MPDIRSPRLCACQTRAPAARNKHGPISHEEEQRITLGRLRHVRPTPSLCLLARRLFHAMMVPVPDAPARRVVRRQMPLQHNDITDSKHGPIIREEVQCVAQLPPYMPASLPVPACQPISSLSQKFSPGVRSLVGQ